MKNLVGSCFAIGLLLVVSNGWAQAADPWLSPPPAGTSAPSTTAPAAPPAPYSPPGYSQPYPPGAYPYGQAPYPGAYPGPYPNLSPAAWMAYENQKHSRGLAFLVEFLLPGGGSIYSDHFAGALLTWGLMVGGVALVVTSFHTEDTSEGYSSTKINENQLLIGVVALLGGRIYGFVDAVSSVSTYNQKLRRSLGLPEWVSLGVTPIRTRDNVAYAPTLRVAF